jgi:hypothetical protein
MDVQELAGYMQELVKCDDPAEVARIETLIGMKQADAVNHFVEDSCCSDDLPAFQGGQGTASERLSALRDLWRSYEGEESEAVQI